MSHDGHSWGADATDWIIPAALATSQAPPDGGSFNWVGGHDGAGDWNTPSDWQQDAVPDPSASATFATGDGGYTVTGDATIAAITVDGDAVTFDGTILENSGSAGIFMTALDGASVTIDDNSSFIGENGALDFTAGSLLDVQGTLLTGGGNADVVVDEGLSGNIVTATPITLNQLYVQTGGSFAGDVILNDGGSITLDTASTFGGGQHHPAGQRHDL